MVPSRSGPGRPKSDDHCHLQGVEIQSQNGRAETPSSVETWHSDLKAQFCLGPLLPAQRTDPNAPAGRAKVTWSAQHIVRYSQFVGCGPFTVTNNFEKTFFPNENSGSIGPVDSNSVSLAFFPRPTDVEVTASRSENPSCEANNPDRPMVWPEGSTIWGGIGFKSAPWSGRVTVRRQEVFSQTLPVLPPVGFAGPGGQSTLRIWFVTRNKQQASQPCQIPP